MVRSSKSFDNSPKRFSASGRPLSKMYLPLIPVEIFWLLLSSVASQLILGISRPGPSQVLASVCSYCCSSLINMLLTVMHLTHRSRLTFTADAMLNTKMPPKMSLDRVWNFFKRSSKVSNVTDGEEDA